LRVVAALFAALALAAPAFAAPPVWAVRSPTATIYLFGTIHLMTPNAAWRSPALDEAYAKSSTVWFETDVNGLQSGDAAKDLVLQYGLDPDHPLSSKVDATHLAALKSALAPLNLPEAGLERMQPWIVSLMLLTLPMQQAGFDPKSGADVQLGSEAAADHKTIRFFETPEQQAHVFADMPQAAQVQMLDQSIDEHAKTGAEIKAMEAAWLAGDLNRLGPLMIGQMKTQYPAFYESLLLRRNHAWAETLAAELTGHDVELVNVGALHMAGPDGLPALLKARGFRVTRLQ